MTYKGAWFGDPALKEEALLRLKEHRAQDRLIQGWYQARAFDIKDDYWREHYFPQADFTEYKGCAIGCTLPYQADLARSCGYDFFMDNSNLWYRRLEQTYGIDYDVASLIDDYFEAQDGFEDAAIFAVDVIEAIEVGADLRGVDEFYAWEDRDPTPFLNWLKSRRIMP